MRRLGVSITLLAAVGACTTGGSVAGLREGMTPGEVQAIMGRPDGMTRAGNRVGWQYANRLMSGWSWDQADYYAVFEDTRLAEWGAGQVRQNPGPQGAVLVVVPVR